ncbi:MAG TPA: hypothetical protein DD381_04805 [Lentisphaeria bacterium]|nr:MAG: hypothetical protein A2X47_01715 [Lentisphaerae bacterium GWF2_38_69]HBM15650.1 hypothetical protein [Lentisphaeria bacterium]
MKKAIVSWSGGKDSCLALNKAKALGFQIIALITAISKSSRASKSNSVPVEILFKQAETMKVELISFETTWTDYEEKLIQKEQSGNYSFCRFKLI